MLCPLGWEGEHIAPELVEQFVGSALRSAWMFSREQDVLGSGAALGVCKEHRGARSLLGECLAPSSGYTERSRGQGKAEIAFGAFSWGCAAAPELNSSTGTSDTKNACQSQGFHCHSSSYHAC